MANASKPRNVLITGGTGSVGTALVEAFTAIADSVSFQFKQDEQAASKLAREFGAKPIRLDFKEDFLLPEVNFDVVVNNAGINISDVPGAQVQDRDWNVTMQVNLTAPFRLVKQCLPWMMKQQWGRIINISSIYGLRAVEGNLPYTVSKHGLAGLTKTIAKEYACYGITCNEICPGPIDSEMMRRIGSEAVASTGGTLEAYLQEVCDEIPAKRMAKPKEVASLALFLASVDSAYINGASIPIDGALIT
jgi:NAD(P)-dependent dehydrogenase (short-subunit alcohol dehydrogenase family)